MQYWWLYLLSLLIVIGAQILVSVAYNKYKKKENKKRLTGFEAARRILDANDLNDIMVEETVGNMTDHYDPRRKVIRLSSEVYHDNSIASIAIAAHECGHAIQHKSKYAFIMVRNILVPIVNIASKIGYVVLLIGLIASLLNLAMIGLILLIATLFFQLITLPVEFNASSRAKKILINENIIDSSEKSMISTMLGAAAMTYVASLLANFLEILRLFLIITNRRD